MTPAGRRGRAASAAVVALLGVLRAAPLDAQGLAAGRVLRPAAPGDTVPVPGIRVVLHRIGSDVQGPIDSASAGAGGRFRFRFAPDSGAVYLLSARHQGIEYFSPPVAASAAAPVDTGLVILVHDTSSTAPVGLAARHVVIPRPGDDGTRDVIDLVVLRNEGLLTRVAPDTAAPSWRMPLPPGSEGLEVGESDVSSQAVTRRGDSLYLAAPIGPGEKQLSLQYHLPGSLRTVAVPIGDAGGTVNVLVEETGARVTGEGLAPADTQNVLGRSFRRWTGQLPANAVIRVELPGADRTPTALLAALVGALALGLAAAAWRLTRGAPGRRAQAAAAPRREELLDRLAQLDAQFAGREAGVSADEWQRYLDERARLKAALEAALAGTGTAG